MKKYAVILFFGFWGVCFCFGLNGFDLDTILNRAVTAFIQTVLCAGVVYAYLYIGGHVHDK